MRRPGVAALVAVVVAVAFAPGEAAAVQLQLVNGGYDQLTQVTAPRQGDPPGTLYIVEQEGQVWKRQNGSDTLFLDIRGSVSCCGEQGLLSIAFDPLYASNRFVYVNYTNNGGNTRVVRYRATADLSAVVPGSARVLLAVAQPAGNHNGGNLAFSRGGRLYTGMGDGGGSCDPGGRAQNLQSRHGKLLSMNPRQPNKGWRIDAYGLRNPWRFSFDRKNGRLFIGDVGQDDWEEVNTVANFKLGGRKENFLWDVFEGRVGSECGHGGLRGNGTRMQPITAYSHSLGCSITGGFVYRGGAIRGLRGRYVFADFCSGRIWRILYRNGRLVRNRQVVRDTDRLITSFGEGVGGELYLTHQGGEVYRLVP